MDDEDTLSDVNKPHKTETEDGNLVIEDNKPPEQCESVMGVGESSVKVGGETDETVAVAAGGGGEGVDGTEFSVEMIEQLREEGAGEMIDSGSGDQLLEGKDEGEVRVVETAVVSDVGDAHLEAQIGGHVDEELMPVVEEKVEAVATDAGDAQLEPKIGEHVEEELMPVVEEKVEAVATDAGDAQLEPQIGEHVEEEFVPVVEEKVEVVVAETGAVQQLLESGMDAGVDDSMVMREGMEEKGSKTEMEMGSDEKAEDVGGADNELIDTGMEEKETDTVVEDDGDDKDKVFSAVNDSEISNSDVLPGVDGERVDPVISEDVRSTVVKPDVDAVTEVNENAIDACQQDQVLKLSDVAGDISTDARYERFEDDVVAAERTLLSETKIVDENTIEDVQKDFILEQHVNVVQNREDAAVEKEQNSVLDECLNVAENREEAAVEEEQPAGNTKMESETGVEIVLAKNDTAEMIQFTDGVAEIGSTNQAVADKIIEEGTKMEIDETRSDLDEPGREIDGSQDGLHDEEDETMLGEEEAGTQDTEMETETDVPESGKASAGKRKRGKLLKTPSVSKTTAKNSSRKTVGEDVCFICFDGGDLFLCDRRGCPKAYHPSCVNRDEAFFKAKGRWNCGVHMCSICEKTARYMCFTCPYSLCRSCIKEGVIFCVRGNKGFCETCMRTVTLIEDIESGKKKAQIDFDDRSSWEYLFKDYFMELKSKLSLSSADIAEAKNPWKGADTSSSTRKQESSGAQVDIDDGESGSDDSIDKKESIKPKRRKLRKKSKSSTKKEESDGEDVSAGDKAISSDKSEWASKELLEFVSHMKDGDTSVLSQFDVQALLLEYIKINKLRDPRRKSQIVCDARLQNLFGKPRVGHFEMLKLLESHFFARDEQNDDGQGSVVDTENNQLDLDDNADPLIKGRKHRKRSRNNSMARQSNLDDYAAIDMHNIGLIYMRRKIMEDLLDDADNFQDKVVGTFVRIRISGSTQKQDMYRLVPVVGTSKAAEPYKVNKKTTEIMVEILNLDKTEIIQIDTLSNQDFTEEECKRLRQSIKCGLIRRLTVGEILDKTTEIQMARVNDWLESEVLRLSHLRDRASDLGHRKELRECVEKLQLLKTPEERRRRLEEIPKIHADPKMDPSYESSDENDSETEESRRDAFMRSKGLIRRGRGPISPGSDSSPKDSWSGSAKVPNKNREFSRNLSGNNFSVGSTHTGEILNETSWNSGDRGTQESFHIEKLNSASNPDSAERVARSASRSESLSGVASVPSQTTTRSVVAETAVKINESEKMWHYRDPSGKEQGPFSMVQLRKWSNTGYFPADLRIWRATQKEHNSILLADALAGKFPKELSSEDNKLSPANTLHSPHILAGRSGKISVTSSDLESSNPEPNSRHIRKLSTERWGGNNITSLPSPTPKQNNSGLIGSEGVLLAGAAQSSGGNGVLPSPTAALPNITTATPALALNSIVQSGGIPYSPTPNSQQGVLMGSADALHQLSTNATSEPQAAQMTPTAAQAVQNVAYQNLQADSQGWGAQAGQQPGYTWATSNAQNPSGTLSNASTGPDTWRPPTVQSPATPNASWSMMPVENNTSVGLGPPNTTVGWGPVPANQNMGWGNPAPGNTNMNWGPPPMQAPNTAPGPGWVAPGGTAGANMQGQVGGNTNTGWGPPPQVWGAPPQGPGNAWVPPGGNSGGPTPVQGPVSGNGWVPPSGNPGATVQGPGQGNANQGWGPPPGNQGPWVGEHNHGGGRFSGQTGGQGRDSGFGGGRPWNRRGNSSKRDKVCPYNANGRCRKGAHCNYMHV